MYKEITGTTKDKNKLRTKHSTKRLLGGGGKTRDSGRLKFTCHLGCHRYIYRREMCRMLPN